MQVTRARARRRDIRGPSIVKNEYVGKERITWMVGIFLIFAEVLALERRTYSYIFILCLYECMRERERERELSHAYKVIHTIETTL